MVLLCFKQTILCGPTTSKVKAFPPVLNLDTRRAASRCLPDLPPTTLSTVSFVCLWSQRNHVMSVPWILQMGIMAHTLRQSIFKETRDVAGSDRSICVKHEKRQLTCCLHRFTVQVSSFSDSSLTAIEKNDKVELTGINRHLNHYRTGNSTVQCFNKGSVFICLCWLPLIFQYSFYMRIYSSSILAIVVFVSQVVRLLSRLMTQRAESWTSSQHSTCQCYTEVKLSALSLDIVTLNFMLHLFTQNSISLFLSWFRRWWLFSIVSGWIFVVLRSQRTQQVGRISYLKHKAGNIDRRNTQQCVCFVFFLQDWPRPRSSAPPPRCRGGAALRRLCSESACCCCTGCCCITAASQRAADHCCTCTTRWSLLYETRWGRSPSWARARVHTHTHLRTHVYIYTHSMFCEVKCPTNCLQL